MKQPLQKHLDLIECSLRAAKRNTSQNLSDLAYIQLKLAAALVLPDRELKTAMRRVEESIIRYVAELSDQGNSQLRLDAFRGDTMEELTDLRILFANKEMSESLRHPCR